MTTPDLTVCDGTTVTVTLTGEHAQVVLSEILVQLGGELHNTPAPWDDGLSHPVERYETYPALAAQLVGRYTPAMRQLESQGVREVGADQPPAPGDVTLTWTADMLERMAAGVNEDDPSPLDRRPDIARVIREQLEDAA